MKWLTIYIVLRLTKIKKILLSVDGTVKNSEMSSLAGPPVCNLRSVGQCDRGPR